VNSNAKKRDMFRPLHERLLRLAGYVFPSQQPHPVEAKFGPYESRHGDVQAEFRYILAILEEIAARKVDDYGPFRYDEIEFNWRWEIQSLYQDIERKFGRLKSFIRPQPSNNTVSNREVILETLVDLSVYAARGIQIIVRYEQMIENIDVTTHGDEARKYTEGNAK